MFGGMWYNGGKTNRKLSEVKLCISAMKLCVTHAVTFVGIAFMGKMVSQFSA